MIRIRSMTYDDLPLLMRLKTQAGWNQLEADVQRLLALEPEGGFVAELDGQPVGTTTTCVFGSVAWVAMVLVDSALRGRGLGTALMERALDYLDRRGVQTIRLDATPLGQPIYEKLDFVAEYQLARHEGRLPGCDPVTEVESVTEEHLEDLLRLDHEITCTDRRKLLVRLFEERPAEMRMVRREGRLEGFCSARPGARALYLGPCLANAEAGPLLLTDACSRYAGQNVFLDIPESHVAGTKLAESWGLTVQRRLLRMVRGVPFSERVDQLWASSGPEMG